KRACSPMANNLSTIGFSFTSAGEFRERMSAFANDARERLSCADGEYAIWRSRTGAELWFHLEAAADAGEAERDVVGLTPFFEGKSDVQLRITDIVERPDEGRLEGAFAAWINSETDGDGSNGYPLIFDAVDFGAHKARELPAVWQVRV